MWISSKCPTVFKKRCLAFKVVFPGRPLKNSSMSKACMSINTGFTSFCKLFQHGTAQSGSNSPKNESAFRSTLDHRSRCREFGGWLRRMAFQQSLIGSFAALGRSDRTSERLWPRMYSNPMDSACWGGCQPHAGASSSCCATFGRPTRGRKHVKSWETLLVGCTSGF